MRFALRLAAALVVLLSLVSARELVAQGWECEDCGRVSGLCMKSPGNGAVLCIQDPAGCVLFGGCNVTRSAEIAPDGFRLRREVAVTRSSGPSGTSFSSVVNIDTALRASSARGDRVDCGGYLIAMGLNSLTARTRRIETQQIRI